MRATFRTDAAWLRLDLHACEADGHTVDVLVEGALAARVPVSVGDNRVRAPMPAGVKAVEVWLPHWGKLPVRGLEVGEASVAGGGPSQTAVADVRQLDHPLPGVAAPTETWPALVALRNGWDLTCLGFRGECHLDQTIAAASVDLISICLGINAYGEGSFGPRTWPGQVSRFVQTLRDAHPIVPIAVISSIAAPDREHKPNAVCMTLSQIRRGVVDAVSVLRELGDSGIHLIDGLSLLGVADTDLLADAVHPSPDGYRVIAERIASRLNALLTPSQENGASRVLPMQRGSDQTLQ